LLPVGDNAVFYIILSLRVRPNMANEPNASSMPSDRDASFRPPIPVTIEAASPSPAAGHTMLPPATHPDDGDSTAAVGDEPESGGKQTRAQLQHGTIGFVRKVSCGAFDKKNRFEIARTWNYNSWKGRKEFSYIAEAGPRRFRVSLPCSGEAVESREEWMDIHEANIRGLIFEEQKNDRRKLRVMYFVMARPPQFYERKNSKDAVVLPSRRPYPSNMPVAMDDMYVCAIPWEIQYSRVYSSQHSRRDRKVGLWKQRKFEQQFVKVGCSSLSCVHNIPEGDEFERTRSGNPT
jgi:hypothetical protein